MKLEYLDKEPERIITPQYYAIMQSFKPGSFDEMFIPWYQCFSYILRSYKVGYTSESIESQFFRYYGQSLRHLPKIDLLNMFCGEVAYICDRTNYDRLFSAHSTFINAFVDEMDKLRYNF